jgi:hypothetical protein
MDRRGAGRSLQAKCPRIFSKIHEQYGNLGARPADRQRANPKIGQMLAVIFQPEAFAMRLRQNWLDFIEGRP